MASTCAVPMAMSLTVATQMRQPTAAASFLNPMLPARESKRIAVAASKPARRFEARASLNEKAVTGLTAAALTASMAVPEVAQAAETLTPSLKNFLLSILAGGVVLTVIAGAVIGVSKFDPVKRG
ncbi:unnamed protein product [Cuscuta campestris]|uniref:Photosystem II PsbX n=2 Tax=Cuscuta sect. Cleistogrammica TaxID=1824901 RepID=A0A484KZD5_9ASTE|nr:unnamed protein product [Cuscuta campestris]